MFEGFEKRQPIQRSEAFTLIAAIQHEEEQRGRIDEERDLFRRILNDLETDVITPTEAVEKARSIAEGRMDYN
jgi:hypothetical protein